MKTDYYFKYVVVDHIEHHFNSVLAAKKKAKQLDTKVSLCIFSKKNKNNEVYDEVEVTERTDLKKSKEALIRSFNKLTQS